MPADNDANGRCTSWVAVGYRELGGVNGTRACHCPLTPPSVPSRAIGSWGKSSASQARRGISRGRGGGPGEGRASKPRRRKSYPLRTPDSASISVSPPSDYSIPSIVRTRTTRPSARVGLYTRRSTPAQKSCHVASPGARDLHVAGRGTAGLASGHPSRRFGTGAVMWGTLPAEVGEVSGGGHVRSACSPTIICRGWPSTATTRDVEGEESQASPVLFFTPSRGAA